MQESYKTTQGEKFKQPFIVWIDKNTASAAEFLAAALQDAHRAKIIGETSYKKGTIQSIIRLQNGFALKLTTALCKRPSGIFIDKNGVTPDVAIANTMNDDLYIKKTISLLK